MSGSTTCRVRLRFAKRGDLRLISHHDLMRCLERALRRSGLPVAQTQGFSPRPRAVFAQALGLGIEGRREVLELELTEHLDPADVLARLAAACPPGFDFLEAETLAGRRAGQVAAVSYALEIPTDRQPGLLASRAAFLASSSWPFSRQRPDRTVEIDLRPFVQELHLDTQGTLRFRLRVAPEGSARPEEIVAALGLRELLEQGAVLVRTDVELAPDPTSSAQRPGPHTPALELPIADPTGPSPERTSV